ncbi:hypothetical protein EDB81DRAFT_954024 [Dactylonectria macrodidyma]|uniref:DUF6594 domain-containing protein n=1 Tax=Dactylonectria macrodidyma TaxID=307937 RepID=A0A9P9I7H2_9HYPO|nr:hypothetical protein EDB81DRAFT_954024 [Dactylonectria macrodidyma]
MANLPVITEWDDQSSVTGTNASPSESPISDTSSRTTQTSATNAPLFPQVPATTSQSTLRTVASSEDAVAGWPSLAKEMAEVPEFEAFSRFRELNIKNLLYYQVEIACLEAKLKSLEVRDAATKATGGLEANYSRLAERMIRCQDRSNPKDHLQWDVVTKIRERLKEYNASLLQHAQISALPEPDSDNVECLRQWLGKADGGNYKIMGKGSEAWGDQTRRKEEIPLSKRILPLIYSIFQPQEPTRTDLDLVTTQPRQKVDGLTRWVANEWIPFYHDWRYGGKKGKGDQGDVYQSKLETYSGVKMLRFTSAVATVVACLLPTLAIGVLTTAKGTLQKLGYIAGFTAMFSIGLMWLTDAGTSRVQIFTATAAFSAVLVVFVQNQ